MFVVMALAFAVISFSLQLVLRASILLSNIRSSSILWIILDWLMALLLMIPNSLLIFLETTRKLSGSLLAIFQRAPHVRAPLQGKPSPHRDLQGKIPHKWHHKR